MQTRKTKPKRSPQTAKQLPDIIAVRKLAPLNRLLLFVRAGGRCEFDGCNKDLLRHHVTLTEGNFAQIAHIVAFKVAGPRGDDARRPADINDVDNLMLLCPQCHKLIDDHPGDYSRRTLEEYKFRHEKRIRYLTALGPERKTSVIVLKSRIGGHVAHVSYAQVIDAVAPLYPSTPRPFDIDLSAISDANPGFFESAKHEIANRLQRFFEPGGEGNASEHISVFGLAPIPLLVFLGSQLTNKVPSDIYQRHRDKEDWTWKKKGSPVRYTVRQVADGGGGQVALVLALSGSIPVEALPESAREGAIYEITLENRPPAATFLALRQDLENFRIAYQEALGLILKNHGLVERIDFFPAVPAPIAVLCGRELLPKVHPRIRVYDYDRNNTGFTFALEV